MATITGRLRRRAGDYNMLHIVLNNKYDRAAATQLQREGRISNPLPTNVSRNGLLPAQQLVNQRANELRGRVRRGEIAIADNGTMGARYIAGVHHILYTLKV